MKTYKLLSALDAFIQSTTPGTLGGNSKAKIYGRLDCGYYAELVFSGF